MKLPRPVIQRVLLGVFALVLASLAVAMANRWVTTQREALEEERRLLKAEYKQPVEVIVASKDVAAGVTVSADYLQTAKVPEQFLQPYAARSHEQVLGLVTVAPVAAGEQVLLNKVRRPEATPAGATLSRLMRQGQRAVTIGVDTLTGVGGFVQPGDTVDLLWTVRLPGEGGQGEQAVTVTLFQGVSVMAVGNQMVGRKERAAGQDSQSRDAFTVTLALTPQETSFLLFAREQGRVQLSLRSFAEESGQVAVTPANVGTLNAFLSSQSTGAPPEPSPPTKTPRSVEVYKGLKRDVVFVEQ